MLKTKKVLSLVLAFLLIASFGVVPAHAEEEGIAQPFYIVSCPSGSKHYMVARGRGTIYAGPANNPGPAVLSNCFVTQCTRCHLVLASEGNMYDSGIIGRYATWNVGMPVNLFTFIYGGLHGSFYGNKATDPYWSGFEWH